MTRRLFSAGRRRVTQGPFDKSDFDFAWRLGCLWCRGMSGDQGIEQPGYGAGITPLERIVMVSVYLAVICFLLWFFLLAGAPTPSL